MRDGALHTNQLLKQPPPQAAMSIGTGDWTTNVQGCLRKAVNLITEEDMEGNYELVTVGCS